MVLKVAPRILVSPTGVAVGAAARGHAQDRIVESRRLADIERRVGVEDLQPAHEQEGDADDVDPVGDPRRQRVAVDELSPPLGCRRQCRCLSHPCHLPPDANVHFPVFYSDYGGDAVTVSHEASLSGAKGVSHAQAHRRREASSARPGRHAAKPRLALAVGTTSRVCCAATSPLRAGRFAEGMSGGGQTGFN